MTPVTGRSDSGLRVSVREARLTLDRIFLAAGVHDGLVPAVREHALVSAALGLGGWAMVRDRHQTIGAGDASTITSAATAGDLHVDAAGLSPWLAGATILDLAIEAAQQSGRATVVVHNVTDPEELDVLTALGRRHGASVAVRDASRHVQGAILDVTLGQSPQTPAEWDPVLDRALHEGLEVEAGLWWELHHLSNRALSPDTVESRRHAGPIIITADGQIIGRQVDDETDVSLLKSPNATAVAAKPA